MEYLVALLGATFILMTFYEALGMKYESRSSSNRWKIAMPLLPIRIRRGWSLAQIGGFFCLLVLTAALGAVWQALKRAWRAWERMF